MARPFALVTEILEGLHEAGAEQLCPETVHDYAGGKRVIGLGEPAGEAEAVVGRAGGPRGRATPRARRR